MIIRQYKQKSDKEAKLFQIFKLHNNDRFTRLSKYGGSGLGHWRKAELKNKHLNNAEMCSLYLELVY